VLKHIGAMPQWMIATRYLGSSQRPLKRIHQPPNAGTKQIA